MDNFTTLVIIISIFLNVILLIACYKFYYKWQEDETILKALESVTEAELRKKGETIDDVVERFKESINGQISQLEKL